MRTNAPLFRGAHMCYGTIDIATKARINAEMTVHEIISTYEAILAGFNHV